MTATSNQQPAISNQQQSWTVKRIVVSAGCGFLLAAGCWLLAAVEAAERPSLFRGVVVADSSVGVRVVSVQEGSQAALADLRPDDLVVSVESQPVRSIDEFAQRSQALKGRMLRAKIVVFRRGAPQELLLHLYSYPILRGWGIEFVPDDELRFAQTDVGLAYWRRLARGFEEAGKTADALNAYLNGLHNVSTDVPTAYDASRLSLQLAQERLKTGALADGVTSLHQAVLLMERLVNEPLEAGQWDAIRRHLRDTLTALRMRTAHAMPPQPS